PESQVAHVVYESPVHDEDAHADPVREEERLFDDEGMAASTHSGEQEQADTTITPVDDRHADVAAEMAAALNAFEPVDSASEHAAAERAAAEQAAAEKAAVEHAAAEQAAAERAAAEQVAAEQAAAEQAAAEHAAAEHAAAEQAAAVQDVSEETPEHAFALAGSGQIDADLLEVFVDEAREILDHADGVLAQWHDEPTELSCVGELQRDLHTLKGGARIAGLMPLGDLAHAIETVLEKPIRDAGKTGALIGTLEASFDQLHALVQRVSQGQMPEYPQAMIDRLLGMAGETALGDDTEAASVATPTPVEDAPRPVTPVAFDASDLPELLPEMEQEVHSPQEQIRVRADLLDSLVNHAGEVAIYRSQLEQQVAGYRFNLVELEQTVARLRSQLRMLEIETEAQIIARFQ